MTKQNILITGNAGFGIDKVKEVIHNVYNISKIKFNRKIQIWKKP